MKISDKKNLNIPLTIELVPSTCWYNNIRNNIDKNTWDKIRKRIYKLAKYSCEICGGHGKKWPVECHEIWEYIENDHIQKLNGLIALCPKCHKVKHIGRTIATGRYLNIKKHLSSVNNWNKEQTENYINKVFEIWKNRSNYEWTLDLTWLNNFINNEI